MTTLYWIITVSILVPVAWWLGLLTLSFLVPEHVSGVALFKQELGKRGVQYAHLPPEFFNDCVEWAQKVANVVGIVRRSRLARKAELVGALETIASMVVLWQQDPRDSMFKTYGATTNDYRAIFEKYDLSPGRSAPR